MIRFIIIAIIVFAVCGTCAVISSAYQTWSTLFVIALITGAAYSFGGKTATGTRSYTFGHVCAAVLFLTFGYYILYPAVFPKSKAQQYASQLKRIGENTADAAKTTDITAPLKVGILNGLQTTAALIGHNIEDSALKLGSNVKPGEIRFDTTNLEGFMSLGDATHKFSKQAHAVLRNADIEGATTGASSARSDVEVDTISVNVKKFSPSTFKIPRGCDAVVQVVNAHYNCFRAVGNVSRSSYKEYVGADGAANSVSPLNSKSSDPNAYPAPTLNIWAAIYSTSTNPTWQQVAPKDPFIIAGDQDERVEVRLTINDQSPHAEMREGELSFSYYFQPHR